MESLLRKSAIIAAVGIALIATASLAQTQEANEGAAVPPVFQAVIDCRTRADSTERLACYDHTVSAMVAARTAKDLVVADRDTMRETRKGLFGLSLPALKLFGTGTDEAVTAIESTIRSTYTGQDGFAVFVLQDGARWKQVEGRFQYAKPGQPIAIRQGSLGSFLANVNHQVAIRVIRTQ